MVDKKNDILMEFKNLSSSGPVIQSFLKFRQGRRFVFLQNLEKFCYRHWSKQQLYNEDESHQQYKGDRSQAETLLMLPVNKNSKTDSQSWSLEKILSYYLIGNNLVEF